MRQSGRCGALLVLLGLTGVTAARAQMDTTGWRIEGDSVRLEQYQGRRALFLQNGVAWLPTPPFQDGVVEFDIALDGARGFSGVGFRAVDELNYENYYLRPHQSGNRDATQYTPVHQGYSGWQLYVGDRYTAPLRFRFNQWMHVKLEFQGSRGAVYLDSDTPSQYLPALVRPATAGRVFLTSDFAAARFANVVVRPGPVAVPERAIAAEPVAPGTVPGWRVSSPFPLDRLRDRDTLAPGDLAGLRWSSGTATERGFVNLAENSDGARTSNTILAALTLHARRPGTVRVRFGFSDVVRVYLNGRLLYLGDDRYQTRDYRFLGTVGLFDTVVLPLEAGGNSLIFAVTEGFGGWVVGAALDPSAGITIEPGCGALRCGRRGG